MSTRPVLYLSLLALAACDGAVPVPDGSIERDSAVSDGGGLLDGGPSDGSLASDAGFPDGGGPICDIAVCDPRDMTSCATGSCSLRSGEPACADGTMPGVLGPESVCSDVGECGLGLACFNTMTGGICARPCCPGELIGCAVGSRCGGAGVLVDGTATGWGRCLDLRSCALLRPYEACEEREGCYLLDGSRMTECRIAGAGGPGDSCSVQEDCQAGFFCGGLATSLQCTRICAVTGDDCPPEEGDCVQPAHTPEGVGLCTLTAMSAR